MSYRLPHLSKSLILEVIGLALTTGVFATVASSQTIPRLSACRTSDGDITSDGAFGLARAFLVGGAPSLVVSLRDVPDDATQALMTNFYNDFLETENKAQALRHAMLSIMDEYPDPRAWGAFTLIGQP